jgi:hypothetical protein
MYVWVNDQEGVFRFVDDQYLPPCEKCGELVGACQTADKCGSEIVSFEEDN